MRDLHAVQPHGRRADIVGQVDDELEQQTRKVPSLGAPRYIPITNERAASQKKADDRASSNNAANRASLFRPGKTTASGVYFILRPSFAKLITVITIRPQSNSSPANMNISRKPVLVYQYTR